MNRREQVIEAIVVYLRERVGPWTHDAQHVLALVEQHGWAAPTQPAPEPESAESQLVLPSDLVGRWCLMKYGRAQHLISAYDEVNTVLRSHCRRQFPLANLRAYGPFRAGPDARWEHCQKCGCQ